MRTPLIAGNWKMHKTVAEGVELVEALLRELPDTSDREVLVCPPYTALYALNPLLQNTPIRLGAQDVFYEEQGAYTAAIAPAMLKELGCSYTIVGHSERRQIFGDTDAVIQKKVVAALKHGIRPVLCVGETKPERDSGRAEDVVLGQLKAGLAGLTAEGLREVVIAYEPVWAIGTGDTASSADAQAMHAAIRKTLVEIAGAELAEQIRILYGGSVKPDNIDELMAQTDIDGALVGGAALSASSFLRIIGYR